MEKVLITGGTGFIGRTLVDRLLSEGKKIAVLTRDKKKIKNSLRGKIDIFEANICELKSLEGAFSRLREVEIIFHLAAYLEHFGSYRNLSKINVGGTVNLFNWAVRTGVKKFIFISSVEAMGPVKENDVPAAEDYFCQPVCPYGKSKLEAEKRIREIAQQQNLEYIILRPSNVYGPGNSFFVLPFAELVEDKGKLLKGLLTYKNIQLNPVFVDDVVEGIIKATEKGKSGEAYILAGNEYTTIGRLLEMVAQQIGMDLEMEPKIFPYRPYLNLRKIAFKLLRWSDLITYLLDGKGKRIHRAYSIEKAQKEIGYSPKINLKEGIKKTLFWAKEINEKDGPVTP